MEDSHNGIAPVLKTGGRKPVGVRVSHPPLNIEKPVNIEFMGFFVRFNTPKTL